MQKLLFTACAAALFLGVTPAWAVENSPASVTNFKGLNGEDLKGYCIFNDKIFSPGGRFCVTRVAAMVCGMSKELGRATWTFTADTNCATSPYTGPQ